MITNIGLLWQRVQRVGVNKCGDGGRKEHSGEEHGGYCVGGGFASGDSDEYVTKNFEDTL